jgi:hypothetical protein
MAKPRIVLPDLLKILKKKPATSPELGTIAKKPRKVIWQNLKFAEQQNLVEKGVDSKYRLTPLGEETVNEAATGERLLDSRVFKVNSQVIYPPNLPTQPSATCTIHIENPEQILALDKDTKEICTALLEGGGYGTPENTTNLQASAGMVVTAILDLIARQMGLLSNLRSEYADKVNVINYEEMPGGYDNLKRFQDLAGKTKFTFMIKFDGAKWAQEQNIKQLENRHTAGWRSARETMKKWRLKDIEAKINLISQLTALKRNTYEELGIFESEERLREYIFNLFSHLGIGRTDKEVQKKVEVAFGCGLFKCKKSKRFHVYVNSKKLNQFLSLNG